MDKVITQVVRGITVVPTMTGMLVVQTTAIRMMVPPLGLHHSTLATQEVPRIPPHPLTTKTDPLTMGFPKGFHEHMVLDI